MQRQRSGPTHRRALGCGMGACGEHRRWKFSGGLLALLFPWRCFEKRGSPVLLIWHLSSSPCCILYFQLKTVARWRVRFFFFVATLLSDSTFFDHRTATGAVPPSVVPARRVCQWCVRHDRCRWEQAKYGEGDHPLSPSIAEQCCLVGVSRAFVADTRELSAACVCVTRKPVTGVRTGVEKSWRTAAGRQYGAGERKGGLGNRACPKGACWSRS